jgi:hypothetical protein
MSYTTYPVSTGTVSVCHIWHIPQSAIFLYILENLCFDLAHFSEHSSLHTCWHWTSTDESWYLWLRLFRWTLLKHMFKKLGKLTFHFSFSNPAFRHRPCNDDGWYLWVRLNINFASALCHVWIFTPVFAGHELASLETLTVAVFDLFCAWDQ